MPSVFISYNRKDKPFAKKLEDGLAAEGVDVWLDENRLKVGDSIIEKISQAIHTSDYIVAVLSKSSVNSRWVQKELLWAVTKEQALGTTIVLPVIVEECEIPSFLKEKHYIEFVDGKFTKSLNTLLEKLFSSDTQEICEYCKNHVPLVLDRCPHCARSAPAPNLRAARVPIERETLDIRYEAAMKDASARGCERIVREFESSLTESKAVVTRSMSELMRLVSGGELYASYYRLIDSGGQESTWNRLREVVDAILFPGYQRQIRFGVLSQNGMGLLNYGECSLVLRNNLIAHRTSFFEENSLLFTEHHKIRMSRAPSPPPGYRATWNDRAKLAVAKLAHRITTETTPDDFQRLLLTNGKNPDEDDFIEAHIWGSLTILAVERVIVSRPTKHTSEKVMLRALTHKLNRVGIEVVFTDS